MYKNMFFSLTLLSVAGLCLAETAVNAKKEVKQSVNANVATGKVTVEKQPKVGYVDAQQIMVSTEAGKKVEETRKELADNINKKQQELEKKAKEYESKKTTLSKAAQEKTEVDLIKMKHDYENELQVSQQKLNVVTQRALADLEVSTKELAEKERYDVVYDVYSGRPIYVAQDAMQTDKLISLMNKHANEKKAEKNTATVVS